ncbi:MAG: hypothetical protein NTW04_02270 [Elusimicrobia bacterium]|nr:hypothetical protein [Elusimicrobiota bacterium]
MSSTFLALVIALVLPFYSASAALAAGEVKADDKTAEFEEISDPTANVNTASAKSKPSAVKAARKNYEFEIIESGDRPPARRQIAEPLARKSAIKPLPIEASVKPEYLEERKIVIERKIARMRNEIMAKFKKDDKNVRLFLDDNKLNPSYITIKPESVFGEGSNFKPGVEGMLTKIAALMLTSGQAYFFILPEGSYESNAKIEDMSRGIALRLFFARKGISPARMKVHLGNTFNMETPKMFQRDSDGIVILFDYQTALVLKAVSAIKEESPPELSLGIFPSSINPALEEGAIIEFSAVERAARLARWNLKISNANTYEVVQEISGSRPAYHQIYFNGRRDFTGSAFAPGRYECALSASDYEGRKAIVKRVFAITGPAAKKSAGKPAKKPTAAKKGK